MSRKSKKKPKGASVNAALTYNTSTYHNGLIDIIELDVRLYNSNSDVNTYDNLIYDNDLESDAWGDVDDEAYIRGVNRLHELERTIEFGRAVRVKRDAGLSDIVNSVSGYKEDMWDIDATDLTECDCFAPPPEFMLPPPPRPPFIQTNYYCGDDPISDLETCDSEPKIDAYNHSSPSLQTSAAIALCSIVLVIGILIGALLIWKHKRKSPNMFPSKSSSSVTSGVTSSNSRCRLPPPPTPLYEDLAEYGPHRGTLNKHSENCDLQLEMVERKRPTGCTPSGRVFVCGSGSSWRGGSSCGGDTCGAPLYEELPRRPSEESLPGSEEHFAEDELSLVGEKASNCRSCPNHSLPHHRTRPPPHGRRPKSLDRRRGHHHQHPSHTNTNHQSTVHRHPEVSEFHEGVLLDALLRLYPNVGTVGPRTRPVPSLGYAGGAWPGDLPLGHPRMPRASPKPPSQDSSFGSDSGYSNNTCGTCGTRGSGRNRYSAEVGMS